VAVCGGWVMVRPPAGGVKGMRRTEEELDLLEADDMRMIQAMKMERVFGSMEIDSSNMLSASLSRAGALR
jgi:hypothetical protein